MKFNYEQAIDRLDAEANFILELPDGPDIVVPAIIRWDVGDVKEFDRLLTAVRVDDVGLQGDLVRFTFGDEQTDRAMKIPKMSMGVLFSMIIEWMEGAESVPLAKSSASPE